MTGSTSESSHLLEASTFSITPGPHLLLDDLRALSLPRAQISSLVLELLGSQGLRLDPDPHYREVRVSVDDSRPVLGEDGDPCLELSVTVSVRTTQGGRAFTGSWTVPKLIPEVLETNEEDDLGEVTGPVEAPQDDITDGALIELD